MPTIAIFTPEKSLLPAAEKLAAELNLELITAENNNYQYLLILTPENLSLKKVGAKFSPLAIDFLSAKLRYRITHANRNTELLIKALSLKKNIPKKIVDATGGLGVDSFIIAALGYCITMLERSPIIHALLLDGIKRAQLNKKINPILARMKIIKVNAHTWLKEHPADIIYLDPMFPHPQKSALANKEMQIFKEIVGQDTDSDQLLTVALACATDRVVVKRPRVAPFLGAINPTYSLKGNSCRFDIYLGNLLGNHF